ncbi:MAG: response regulator [Chloroflexota bacterium]
MSERRVVLAVDDDEAILDIVEWALVDEGYEVKRASDGSEALVALRTLRPVVILLDMRMPGMNGWEFAEAYGKRQNGRRAPVIVMSAAQDVRRLAAEIGADGYVGKPFDVDELIDTVHKHAGNLPN